MAPDILIKKLLAQRESWVDLGDGKRVRIRRPAETEIFALLEITDGKPTSLKIGLDEVKRRVVDWEGFTEADLIVSGASDAVDFDAALWSALIDDRREWVPPIARALIDAIVAHESATEAARGN